MEDDFAILPMSCEHIRSELSQIVIGQMQPGDPNRLATAALIQVLEARCGGYGHAEGIFGSRLQEFIEQAEALIALYPPPPEQ